MYITTRLVTQHQYCLTISVSKGDFIVTRTPIPNREAKGSLGSGWVYKCMWCDTKNT